MQPDIIPTGMHTLAHITIRPYPWMVTCTHTRPRLTLPCLLNIGTKENICILSRPTSFDCSSAAVGNNAQALLIHQGEREFLLEESSKEPPARLFTAWLADWLIDWMTGYTMLTVGSASCLTRLLFTARTLTCWHVQYVVQQRGSGTGSCIIPPFIQFADDSVLCRFQCHVSKWSKCTMCVTDPFPCCSTSTRLWHLTGGK